jgi:hypothetical protein
MGRTLHHLIGGLAICGLMIIAPSAAGTSAASRSGDTCGTLERWHRMTLDDILRQQPPTASERAWVYSVPAETKRRILYDFGRASSTLVFGNPDPEEFDCIAGSDGTSWWVACEFAGIVCGAIGDSGGVTVGCG